MKAKTIELKLRAMPVAVVNAVFAMPLYRRVQVDRVIEPEPAPVQSVATPKDRDNAQDCAIAEPVKTCRGCGEAKPLSKFYKCPTLPDGRRSICAKCEYAERAGSPRLEAHATVISKATAGLVTVEALTMQAKKAKAHKAIYEVGRTKIEARYSKREDEVSYFVQGWPCHASDVHRVLVDIHSGHGVRGLA